VPNSHRLFLVVTLGAIVACTGGSTGGGVLSGGTTGAPTGSQRTELALALEDELEALVAALTLAGPGLPPTFVIAGCPTVSASADIDGDSIPDDQTLTYTNPPCSLAGFRGGIFGVTGTVRVQDTTPSDSVSYNLTLTDLAWTATDPATFRTFTATRNGIRSRTATDSSGVLTTTMNVVRQRPNRANTTIDFTSVTEFVPDTTGSLRLGQRLPNGKLTVAGSMHWVRSTEDWTITVSTPVPLTFDPICIGTPQLIRSGILALEGTINGATGTLRLIFAACGSDPIVTWTDAS
jgi:hypothetical protein